MSHIDTLKVYESYIKAGFDDKQARAQTDILEHSFMTKVKELGSDFASQKLLSILGAVIVIIGGFTLHRVWDLSHTMAKFEVKLDLIDKEVRELKIK